MSALTEQDALTYLELGVTPIELVKLRDPNLTDDEASYILWEKTPFPIIDGVLDIVDAIAAIDEEEWSRVA